MILVGGGAPAVGKTVRVDISGISDANIGTGQSGTYTYQWQNNAGVDKGGETSRDYILIAADIGASNLPKVKVTLQDSLGFTSDWVAEVQQGVGVQVTRTGAQFAAALTDLGNLVADNSESYVWLQSDAADGTYAAIVPSATNATYDVPVDYGTTHPFVRVSVTYTDTNSNAANVVSSPIRVAGVASGTVGITPPTNVGVGGVVNSDIANLRTVGERVPRPVDLTYQWYSGDGSNWNIISSNGTGASYIIAAADFDNDNRQLSLQVTDPAGLLTAPLGSNVVNLQRAAVGDVAINLSTPAAIGANAVANVGGVNDANGEGTYTYAWYFARGSGALQPISSATSDTYVISQGDLPSGSAELHLLVSVTHTDALGFEEVLQLVSVTLTDIASSGAPAVASDSVRAGGQLTADVSGISDNNGEGAYTYQWQRWPASGSGWEDIGSATGATYTLPTSNWDARPSVRVSVVHTDDLGYTANLVSPPRTINQEPNGTPQVEVVNNVTPVLEGVTVRVVTTGITDSNNENTDGTGGAFTYQWQESNGDAKGGQTSRDYILTDADIAAINGSTPPQVAVTYTDELGFATVWVQAVAVVVGPPVLELSLPVTGLGTATVSIVSGANLVSPSPPPVYQWQNASAADSTFADIDGATGTTYEITDSYDNTRSFLRVKLSYDATEIVYSPAKQVTRRMLPSLAMTLRGAEVSVSIANDTVIATSPAMVYQWQNATAEDGTFADITDATNSDTYTIGSGYDNGRPFVRVSMSYTHTAVIIGATNVISPPILVITPPTPVIVQNGRKVSLETNGFPNGVVDKSSILEYSNSDTPSDFRGSPFSGKCVGILDQKHCRPILSLYATGTDAATGLFILADSYFLRPQALGRNIVGLGEIQNNIPDLGFWPRLDRTQIVAPKRHVRMYLTYKYSSGGATHTLESNFVSLTLAPDAVQLVGGGTHNRALSISVLASQVSLFSDANSATFQWQSAASADDTYAAIASANSSVYAAPSALTHNRFYRAVWEYNYVRIFNGASRAGRVTITLAHALAAPTVPVLSFSLPSALNQSATVSIDSGNSAISGTPIYQWQNATTEDGDYLDIQNAVGTTYEINTSYDNTRLFLRVKLTYTHNIENILVTAYSPVQQVPEIMLPSLALILRGTEVSVSVIANDNVIAASPAVVYQWQNATNPIRGYANIAGATNSDTYTIGSGYDNSRPFVRVSVSYTHTAVIIGATNVISPPILVITPPAPVIVQNGRKISLETNGFPNGVVDKSSILEYSNSDAPTPDFISGNVVSPLNGKCVGLIDQENCRPILSQYATGTDAATGLFILADSYFLRPQALGNTAVQELQNNQPDLGFLSRKDQPQPINAKRHVRMYLTYKYSPGGATYTLESNFVSLTLAPDAVQLVGGGTHNRALSISVLASQVSLFSVTNSATFQWQSAASADDTYADIASANSSVYAAPSALTHNRFYRAVWEYNYVRIFNGASRAGRVTITLAHALAAPTVPVLSFSFAHRAKPKCNGFY